MQVTLFMKKDKSTNRSTLSSLCRSNVELYLHHRAIGFGLIQGSRHDEGGIEVVQSVAVNV
jgi:hypothetical protein